MGDQSFRVHFHTFNGFWVLLLPASTIRAKAKHDVAALKARCGEDLVSRVDDPMVPAKTAVVALAIFITPKGCHLAFGDGSCHSPALPTSFDR